MSYSWGKPPTGREGLRSGNTVHGCYLVQEFRQDPPIPSTTENGQQNISLDTEKLRPIQGTSEDSIGL